MGKPPIPKEHGAWALLYGPVILALTVTPSFEPKVFALLAAMSALFLAHEPLSKLARSSRHPAPKARSRQWKRWLLLYLAIAAAGGGYLLASHHLWLLIPLGLVVALLLVLHLSLVAGRRERSVFGELIGVLGLTSSAPVTCYVITSTWDTTCVLLWALAFLYFASGIFYVKMKVGRFTKPGDYQTRVRHCLGYHLFVFLALSALAWSKTIPLLLPLAYVPMLLRTVTGLLLKEERLNIKRIGYLELAGSVIFLFLFAVLWE